MLASATARAVAFSALTTGTAFGSLALSGQPGTMSMRALLLVSLLHADSNARFGAGLVG